VSPSVTSDSGCTTAADCVVTTDDQNGNVTKTPDASGTTTSSYNTANELTAQALPGAVSRTCAGINDTAIHYTHDPAGNIATYCDAGGTVPYSYDAANHNTGVADPGGHCTANPVVAENEGQRLGLNSALSESILQDHDRRLARDHESGLGRVGK
jgi:YD repeat-containing protein